jgi:hypothetical protein
MVLTYDTYSETVIEHQEKEDQILGHFKSYSALVFASIPRIQTTIQYKFIENKTKREEDEKGNKNKVISKLCYCIVVMNDSIHIKESDKSSVVLGCTSL